MGMHFNNNQLTLSKFTWIGFSMGLSLACFHLYGGRKQLTTCSINNIAPLMWVQCLSKVVALVANLGKFQQYKLNEANLWGGHTCVIVDGGLYSFIHSFCMNSSQTMLLE